MFNFMCMFFISEHWIYCMKWECVLETIMPHITTNFLQICHAILGFFHYSWVSRRHFLYGMCRHPCWWLQICFLWSFNSLRPDDAIWRHGTRSTLAQVMACCLSQCWLIIGEDPWHSSQGIIPKRCEDTINKTRFKIAVLKLHLALPGANEFKLNYLEYVLTDQVTSVTAAD